MCSIAKFLSLLFCLGFWGVTCVVYSLREMFCLLVFVICVEVFLLVSVVISIGLGGLLGLTCLLRFVGYVICLLCVWCSWFFV